MARKHIRGDVKEFDVCLDCVYFISQIDWTKKHAENRKRSVNVSSGEQRPQRSSNDQRDVRDSK